MIFTRQRLISSILLAKALFHRSRDSLGNKIFYLTLAIACFIVLFINIWLTCARYSAVERASVIGAISSIIFCAASSINSSLISLPFIHCSVLFTLTGLSATAPRTILISSHLPLLIITLTAQFTFARSTEFLVNFHHQVISFSSASS